MLALSRHRLASGLRDRLSPDQLARPLVSLLAGGFVAAGVSACGASTAAEATYRIWRPDCHALVSYTHAELVQAWGQGALAHGQLQGEPAALDRRCEAQRRREPGP
jgi:hypothetical protein